MTEEQGTNTGKKMKKDRSTAYPAIHLGEAIEYSKKLITAYPKSQFDRVSAAVSMGYATLSGASAPKVAALAHYGLLDRKGNAYKNSDLAERILHYSTEEEKAEAILEAVKHPKLFESLIGEYSGRAIPTTLNNILVRQYKISLKVADTVVQIFKESLEFAGLYSNGIVSEHASQDTETPENGKGDGKNIATGSRERDARPPERQKRMGMVDVELPSGIVLSYPVDIAYLFAIGKFGDQIAALDKAVTDAKPKEDNKHGDNDTSATK
ncbi:MAG: hypothetical protein Q7R89_03490 [bacterium]|nr:hypothetical protein [bacterium]